MMGTLIIYMSRHGSAEKSAKLLNDKVNADITLIDLKKDRVPTLADFDTVIIGGSIHFGRIQDKIKKYCLENENQLLEKKLGLYLCCMKRGEIAQQQFVDAYPETLRQHAEVKGIFGGEFMFEKMNFLEKMIVRNVANVRESVSDIDMSEIERFAGGLSVQNQKTA